MKTTYMLSLFSILFLALVTPVFAHQQHNYQRPTAKFTVSAGSATTLNLHHSQTAPATTTPVVSTPTPVSVSAPAPTPAPSPSTSQSASGEVRMTAYTTGYGWPDNTPAGGAISNPVIHQSAGGTGTYADPITLAVGHSITNGVDTLDYPAGTKFYIPNLRKYFIVEDTCGDGNTPQNGPCHTGYQGHVWVDLWVGGQGLSSSGTFACEDAITDLHLIIENPASNYAVVPGPVYSGTCAEQFGDTVVTQ